MSIGTVERMLHWRSRIRTRLFTMLISGQFGQIGPGARVTPPFRFANLYLMNIGVGVIIHRDCWIHAVRGYGSEDSPKLIINANAGIGMGATISAAQQVVIGEYALLARNVYIADHGHAFEDVTIPIMNQGVDNIRPVSIGRHTWLGQNVVVLPGVSIGEHCVIGANSVVNRSIPDFSVAVGSPARVVKRYNKSSQRWERSDDKSGQPQFPQPQCQP